MFAAGSCEGRAGGPWVGALAGELLAGRVGFGGWGLEGAFIWQAASNAISNGGIQGAKLSGIKACIKEFSCQVRRGALDQLAALVEGASQRAWHGALRQRARGRLCGARAARQAPNSPCLKGRARLGGSPPQCG